MLVSTLLVSSIDTQFELHRIGGIDTFGIMLPTSTLKSLELNTDETWARHLSENVEDCYSIVKS